MSEKGLTERFMIRFRLASTWCAQLNDRRRPDDRIRWDLHDGDTCAIVDTETPAPPAEERRPAAGWREALPGYYVLDVTATLTAHVERMANGAAWWTWVDGDSKRGRLEGGALAAAQLAAEDAAARLLVDAIAALPNARAVLVAALATLEGR